MARGVGSLNVFGGWDVPHGTHCVPERLKWEDGCVFFEGAVWIHGIDAYSRQERDAEEHSLAQSTQSSRRRKAQPVRLLAAGLVRVVVRYALRSGLGKHQQRERRSCSAKRLHGSRSTSSKARRRNSSAGSSTRNCKLELKWSMWI